MRHLRPLLIVLLFLAFLPLCLAAPAKAPSRPKLVVLIVFDQFRSDYLTRFESRFLPARLPGGKLGGFRALMAEGAYYPYAEYDLLQCMTGPGHAALLTGSYSYQNGIPINIWYNSTTRSAEYCVEDPASPVIGAGSPPEDSGSSRKKAAGFSPKNLIGNTVGDELKMAGYGSRVISIALKDRSAILMGGHLADLALWMDPSFRWVSSRHYLKDGKLPAWVEALNQKLSAEKGQVLEWKASGRGSGLSVEDPMILQDEWNAGRIGKAFPHQAKKGSNGSLNLPYGLELTLEAAKSALRNVKLGSGPATDVLAISFSTHDYLAHAFGPNSREMEELTMADDRIVSDLLNTLQKEVPGGLKNVVVALTGDHGGPSNPDLLRSMKIPAERLDSARLSQSVEDALNARFGTPSKNLKWLSYHYEFNFYLNPEALKDRDVQERVAQDAVKKALVEMPWVARAFTRTEFEENRLPPAQFSRQIQKTFHPGRSGDVIAIPKPFFITNGDTTNHMTGYAYDRMVPLLLSGPGIRKGKRAEKAEVVDLAPTLSFLLGTTPPSLSEGRVLHEALK